MINAIRLVLFGFSLFVLALAFSLQEVNSAFIDFTAIPSQELQIFRFALYVVWIGLMLATAMVGGRR